MWRDREAQLESKQALEGSPQRVKTETMIWVQERRPKHGAGSVYNRAKRAAPCRNMQFTPRPVEAPQIPSQTFIRPKPAHRPRSRNTHSSVGFPGAHRAQPDAGSCMFSCCFSSCCRTSREPERLVLQMFRSSCSRRLKRARFTEQQRL